MARLRHIDLVLNYIQAQVKDSSSIRISIRFRISKEKEMASFRKFALVAVVLLAFAGMLAAADSVIIVPTGYPGFRAEGLTEPVPAMNFNFAGLGFGKATYDVFIYGKAGAPITSPASAVVQLLTNGSNTPAGLGGDWGTVSILGGAVKIAGVQLTPDDGGGEVLQVSGIRLNANAIGQNNAVSFTIVMIPTAGVTQNSAYGALTQDVTVGVVNPSLKITTDYSSKAPLTGTVTSSSWGPASADVDGTKDVSGLDGPLFNVTFDPLYAGAFKTVDPEKNLRFTYTLSNLPTGLALWAPASFSVDANFHMILVSGADSKGAGGTLTDGVGFRRINAVGATSGQVTYVLSGGGLDYTVDVIAPVYSSVDAVLGLTSAASPVTLVASYAPLSTDVAPDAYADAGLLRFATTSITTISGFLTTTPSTVTVSLPYVVTDGDMTGWVTGMAIGNTGGSKKVFTNKGATGTCTLSFFSKDGIVAAPAAITTGPIVPGGTLAFTLDQAAYLGTTAYAGQVVVQCNFDHMSVYSYATGHGTTGVYAINR
jgi:hypothetical protein